ncbi:MAG: glycosyltransferase family 4 protein [Thermoplasmataceae archaeon]
MILKTNIKEKEIIILYAGFFPIYPIDNGFNVNEREIIKTLLKHKFNVTYIQGNGANYFDYPKDFRKILQIVPSLELRGGLKLLNYIHFWLYIIQYSFRIKKIYKPILIFFGPDLVVPGILLKKLLRIHYIASIGDSWLSYNRKIIKVSKFRYNSTTLFEKLSKYASKIILVSEKEAKYLGYHGFDNKKIVVDQLSGFSVNKKLLDNRAEIRMKILTELNIDSECNFVFFHGVTTYKINIAAFEEICNWIAPKVKKMDNKIIFVLAGGDLNEVGISCKSENIISLGYIEDREKLASYLVSADLYILPSEFGSGIKTKLLEAMNAGTPILTTEFIKKEYEGEPPFILAKMSNFPEKIVNVLNNENLMKSLRKKTLEYAKCHDNTEHKPFVDAIDDILSSMK